MQPNPRADNQLYTYTGKTNNHFSFRNSTVLFETQTPDEYSNSEVRFTAFLNAEYKGTPHNEISVRWSIGPHIGDSIVKCFDVGYGIATGKTRIRYEHQHPEYTDALATGDTVGEPLSRDTPIDFRFVKLDMLQAERATLFEVHTKKSSETEWNRVFSYTDKDHGVDNYPQGCQIAIKAKDPTDSVVLKDISVVEIE